MKNLVKAVCLVFAITLFTNLFTSCKKDTALPSPEKIETPEENPTENNDPTITNVEVAKMMKFAGDDDFIFEDSTDLCDCFDLFDDVDWEASEAVILAQLEAIFETLTEDEIEALFTPVCTSDGAIYINECVAICNNETDFEPCEFEGETEAEWEECFSFVYPITVIFPDGISPVVNSNDELIDAVDTWYDANPNSDDDPTLAYPVDIMMIDGTTVAITNDDELEDLFDDCEDNEMEECFTFIFPMTLLFPDGTTQDINSIDEGEAAVEAWEDTNPNGDDVTIVFPIQVTLDDGTIHDINNEDELDALFEMCDFDDFCLTSDAALTRLKSAKLETR